MEVQKATREFRYNSVVLPDPDPNMSLEQVRDTFSTLYPEIVNADIEGPESAGTKVVYTFRRAVGTKGANRAVAVPVDVLERIVATQIPEGSFSFDLDAHQATMISTAKAVSCALDERDGEGAGKRVCAPSESLPPLP
jgi:PRTRC genetic system protein C